MTTIKDRLINDIKDTMRARDQKKLGTLRLISAAIKQKEVDERINVDDTALLIILDKLTKQRRESIEQFKAAKRDDLVTQEEYELAIIATYLPKPLSDDEINDLIKQAIDSIKATKISDMGRIMAYLKPLLQGRADMSQVSLRIKTMLN